MCTVKTPERSVEEIKYGMGVDFAKQEIVERSVDELVDELVDWGYKSRADVPYNRFNEAQKKKIKQTFQAKDTQAEENVKSTYEDGYKDGMEGQKFQAEEMMREVLPMIEGLYGRENHNVVNKYELLKGLETIAQKYGIDVTQPNNPKVIR